MTNEVQSSWSVLVIDDDPDFCLLLQTALPKTFRVDTSASGEEGLEAALGGSHDLILLDVLMPGIHGFHALERLKNEPNTKDTPILITSNLPPDQVEMQAAEHGAGYINKQMSIKEIVARIRRTVKDV
ncbi:MAG: response regulator [Elusimicrobiota bacterium]